MRIIIVVISLATFSSVGVLIGALISESAEKRINEMEAINKSLARGSFWNFATLAGLWVGLLIGLLVGLVLAGYIG